MRIGVVLSLVVSAVGCAKSEAPVPAPTPPPAAQTPAPPPAPAPPFADRDWDMVSMGESVKPVGAGSRPPTIRFDAATGRAAGFAGCNRFSAGYQFTGEGLRFTPAISTKMACDAGMDVESKYLALLSSVVAVEATDTSLVLKDAAGPLARFRPGAAAK